MARKIDNIVIHCSDSAWGNAAEIRKWHLARGWSDIGYHFVVTNGMVAPGMVSGWPFMDGSIECGRRLDDDQLMETEEIGSHALGFNDHSIGICLIGIKEFTYLQLDAVSRMVRHLQKRFSIRTECVVGHCETPKSGGKTCPNIPMDLFREFIQCRRSIEQMQQDIRDHNSK